MLYSFHCDWTLCDIRRNYDFYLSSVGSVQLLLYAFIHDGRVYVDQLKSCKYFISAAQKLEDILTEILNLIKPWQKD
jgi:hypothetical protein